MSTLLASSAATRTTLRDAVHQVRACANLPGAVSEIGIVVNQRLTESRRAAALPMAALPDGAAVKSDLIAALSSSLQADRDYLAWAQQEQAGRCTPAGQPGIYRTALTANQAADAAKQAFVQVWDRVAAQFGVKQILPDSF